MVLGTAGMLASSALYAADASCNAPAACCTPAPSCCTTGPACCDGIFQDAKARLNGYYAGLNCDSCAAPATPAPVCGPAASCAPAAAGCTAAAGGCGATGGSSDPFSLTDLFTDGCGQNHLKDNGWKIGGNIAQSYTMNFNNPSNKWNGPVTWTDRSNEYELNQLWLYGEKVTDTTKKDWDWGARGDILYGTNARLTTESGLETPHLNGPGIYGLAIPQFYFDVAYKKLKIRAGHFISPIGYFTVDTTQNFFNTIPYTYQWGEPFTHTGATATYQFTDQFVVSSGLIRGWDNFAGGNGYLGNLTTWTYTFKDKSSLAQVIVASNEPNFYNQFTQRYYQSLVYTKPIDDNWTYVGQSDFGTQRNATVDGKQANWYGMNQYLFYKVNDKWTWGANFEWWRDEEGFRVASFLPSAFASGITGNSTGVPLSVLPGGYQGTFYQTTIGPRWYPTGKPNFFIRPNFRMDWYSGQYDTTVNPGAVKPFGDGNKLYQPLFVTDVCLTF